jgi:hypothetical protein
LRIAGWLVLVSVLWGLLFGAAVFGVPTVYSWWKQCECWLRGSDSYACWELASGATFPRRATENDRLHKNN